MALARVQSCAVAGLDGELVEVEVDISLLASLLGWSQGMVGIQE